ncbi:hypothetical protein [Actinoplanes philippinensis]|uniref:hypothetical protein n=1 Tax=Actinoplanes philippinensis TaxID=35752 RepID=UPI0033D2BA25
MRNPVKESGRRLRADQVEQIRKNLIRVYDISTDLRDRATCLRLPPPTSGKNVHSRHFSMSCQASGSWNSLRKPYFRMGR